ncbi:hypothetical protein IVB41_09125 [Bradyrhizobium sp. 44]|uniref:hypothetical protein n=1 Tax=Bradyrhizobium sp. 44 TaxID=2782675 RepID=UPI001FF7B0F0|nr:hypothetical protein [Bradyrhizobium sp. 44]MCK1284095.1 hypothetical protein [Bradyrhizobium sp. 44]
MLKDQDRPLSTAVNLLTAVKRAFDEAQLIIEEAASFEREYFETMPPELKLEPEGRRSGESATLLEDIAVELIDFDLADLIARLIDASSK